MTAHAATSDPAGRALTRTATWSVLCAFAAIVALAYHPALDGPFLLDDQSNLPRTAIASLSLDELARVATGNTSGLLGRSLPALSFALNQHFGDGTAWSFKAVNLLLHLINGALVYLLAARVLIAIGPGRPDETDLRTGALIVACLWLAHPMHVSTAMYVVQRMMLLSTAFTLSSLILYLAARGRAKEGRPGALPLLGGSLAMAALACLSKESGVLVVAYVALLESVIRSARPARSAGEAAFARSALRACAVAFALGAALLAHQWAVFMRAYDGFAYGPLERLWAQAEALAFYLRMIVAPDLSELAFYYDDVMVPADPVQVTPTLALLASIALVAVLSRRRRPVLAFGVGFFFCSHLLESTILPLELRFEHRNYLAVFGLALVAGRLPSALRRRGVRTLPTLVLALVCIGSLTALTARRALMWSDPVVLHEAIVDSRPGSARAWTTLAVHQASRGDLPGAVEVLDRAEASLSRVAHVALQRLQVKAVLGVEIEADVRRAARALRTEGVDPTHAMLMEHLRIAAAAGRSTATASDVLRVYDAAARSGPRRLDHRTEAMFLEGYSALLSGAGRHDDALDAAGDATRANPGGISVWLTRAEAYVAAGRSAEAASVLAAVTPRIDPDERDARRRVENLLGRIGGR